MKTDREVKLSVSTGTFVRFWLVILGFIALAGAIWIARSPLVMFAISFFLALVLNRPVSFLARHLPGKSRSFAIFIAYLLVAAMVGVLLVTIVPIFVRQTASFIADVPSMIDQLRDNSGWITDLLAKYNLTDQFNSWIADMQASIGHFASTMGTTIISAMSNVFAFLGNICLVLFATFFMLLEAPDWEEKFWRLLYKSPVRRRHHKAVARKMYDVVSNYVTGQATVGVISASFTAVVVAILAAVFDFDMTLVWPAWITIFLVVFIPMFGAIIGGTIITLLLLVYSLPAAIIYACVFIIEQQVENNIIQPRIQSKHMEVSALIILIAMTLGLQVGGLLGALVAIPVAGCVVVLMRDFFQERNRQEVADASLGHDNNIDGMLDSSAPVIFVPSDRKYIGPELPISFGSSNSNSTGSRNRSRGNH